jgi:hypothetical protein
VADCARFAAAAATHSPGCSGRFLVGDLLI